MPKLRPLRPGDLIRIVSPASPLTAEQMTYGIELLKQWGFRVELAPHALDRADYLAGTDEDRAHDMMQAFVDDEVAAVYCSRGGYGCARLLPYLDLDVMATVVKALIGFSDVTTLHLALNRRGTPSLHAPMPITLSVPREDWVIESLRRNLTGVLDVPSGAPGGQTIVGGKGVGVVTGGCLCLLTDSFGTPEPLQCADKIVVIEDVDENPHRIDAMLTHLLNEGSIRQAAGIVIGEMTRTDDRMDAGIGARPWREIVVERLAPLEIPMILDYPFGHAPNMLSLPLGVRAELDADAGTLTYLESPWAE